MPDARAAAWHCRARRYELNRAWIVLEVMNQDSWSSVCSRATRPHTGCVIAKL